MSPRPPAPTDGDGVAVNRERFLTAEAADPGEVRETILASWWRSRELKVAADRIELPYIRDPEVDTPLTRSAEPVLRTLRDQLEGQQVSIVLTDSSGLVLVRLTAGAELERYLDTVMLAPGFSYAEEFVGTNGIGTALDAGRPMHVFGHEHYAEHLETLACAGVPIHHPISGKTVGAVDLTCWRRDAGSLLLTLAKSTAEQIRQQLLADTGVRELGLFHEYLRVCRRSTGIVFAVDSDVSMMNDLARTVLDPADQAALLGHGADALAGGRSGRVEVQLPTGATARMNVRPVAGSSGGGVVQVKIVAAAESVPAARPATPPRAQLPGLVGASPLWLRACDEVERAYRAGEWIAVEGEPGVGKAAVLRAVQLRRQPVGRFAALDAAESDSAGWLAALRRTVLADADSVVLRHADTLTGPMLRAVAATLQEASRLPTRPWVAVTVTSTSLPGARGKELAKLLQLFPGTVAIPPLRHHIEDLQRLVPFLLARLGHGGALTCSPEAMQLLMRASWPGNVEQVLGVLRGVVHRRRTGVIRPDDLPPESRTVSRRRLNPLESMERDAIVRSLLDARGNKVKAARALGMSRATIYRKIHEYGIVSSV
jgi:sigma-54 dependent transcriptional regulator, acetoin dehydrogenase operon transcriptional activator AcoR